TADFCAIIAPVTTRARILLIAGLAALLIGGGAAAVVIMAPPPSPPAAQSTASGAAIGGPFTLVAADGKPVTDRAYRGKWMLVYFGYTFCPDVCPTTLNNIAQALGQLGRD